VTLAAQLMLSRSDHVRHTSNKSFTLVLRSRAHTVYKLTVFTWTCSILFGWCPTSGYLPGRRCVGSAST